MRFYILITCIAIIVALCFHSWFFQPAHAAVNFNGGLFGASSTLAITAGSTAKTMIFWGRKNNSNSAFAVRFVNTATGVTVWSIREAGVGGGNVIVCDAGGVTASTATIPTFNLWEGYGCTIDTGNNAKIYLFSQSGALLDSGTIAGVGSNTADSLYIGALPDGTQSWVGGIRNIQIFDKTMTVLQIRAALMANSPYRISSPSYFCPLVDQNDFRCFLNGAKLTLSNLLTALYVIDPPIALHPF